VPIVLTHGLLLAHEPRAAMNLARGVKEFCRA
jgi:hypothetical protein